ncbi:MAG: DUF4363 family protein [Clostridia bacterium]
MRRVIFVICCFFVFASLIIWEEVYVYKFFNDLTIRTTELQSLTANTKNINTAEILSKVESFSNSFAKNEEMLCFLINHKDIDEIGVEIARLEADVALNQIENFRESLSLIVFYSKAYTHIMGTSFQNVF